jgi:copper oxidase (laccase) domain-containing protein
MNEYNQIDFWKKHDNLVSGFTTKSLGNVSFRVGDRREVTERRDRFCKELGISWDNVLLLPLSHSSNVVSVPAGSELIKDESNVYVSGGHLFEPTSKINHGDPNWQNGIDSIVTNIRGLFPVVLAADCAAVGFLDSSQSVIALAHVGVIGAVNRIVINTLDCMIKEYQCDPSKIEVVIFPSIRKCHYDLTASGAWDRIKEGVYADYGTEPSFIVSGCLDLHAIITDQLKSRGVISVNIHDCNMCTVCNHSHFFSNYAAKSAEAKKVEGRFASIIGVKNE